MLLFFALLLIPVAFAGLYMTHSVRQKRFKQAAAVGALLLLELGAAGLLLWEFLKLP